MYKHFYNFNINNLMKIRLHLGHKNDTLNLMLTSYIYGTRHNINIYNLDKFWKPYRYLFYSLTHMFFRRNSFFIIGTNKNLPMKEFLRSLSLKYPVPFYRPLEDTTLKKNNENEKYLYKLKLKKNVTNFQTSQISYKNEELYKYFSYYISGYIDRKWIGGLFTNWKIFKEFIRYIGCSGLNFKKRYRFQKYFFFLKGIKNLAKMPIPDFVIFLDKDLEALSELKKFQIPLIGIVDTNMNPDDFVYKFFGNNDSMETIEFFFEFLNQSIQEGRLREQQLFYYYFIHKLKKKLL